MVSFHLFKFEKWDGLEQFLAHGCRVFMSLSEFVVCLCPCTWTSQYLLHMGYLCRPCHPSSFFLFFFFLFSFFLSLFFLFSLSLLVYHCLCVCHSLFLCSCLTPQICTCLCSCRVFFCPNDLLRMFLRMSVKGGLPSLVSFAGLSCHSLHPCKRGKGFRVRLIMY